MNNLNSVLIEGLIEGFYEGPGKGGKITISSSRYKATANGIVREKSFLDIVISETQKESICLLEKGDLIRVIGRLKGKNPQLVVVADHLEIKRRAKMKQKAPNKQISEFLGDKNLLNPITKDEFRERMRG
jgi:hypothetical protein